MKKMLVLAGMGSLVAVAAGSAALAIGLSRSPRLRRSAHLLAEDIGDALAEAWARASDRDRAR